ncbi:DUF2878 family protein [Pseudoalteromonas piscicida]|uniref:DUF2878 family protein n=1 Tax=Pseudoalteromonas piscicida TaxID=43662 RepID=A0AAD0RTI1_PSEO7|nr:DUF2878 family protein [Pseudoalteromonas piscicida]ASD69248.1 hypothetical protein B1L02_20345 [Pseudoalteromonas piscicida]AXQ99859.1 DUF2878 family protein [Pseudoalteromonas piscicida]AXR04388.1 DUF2878 family protein [Pseudoalteromonas piscicida]
MPVLKHWITNALIFQSIWFAALFFQADALWYMLIGCLVMLAGHQNIRLNLVLALVGSIIGIGIEFIAVKTQLINYQGSELLPLWLWVLWIALVLTINNALSKLLTLKAPLLLLIFLVCAPPSYLGAANFGVVSISNPWYVFWPTFGALWSVGFYMIVSFNRILWGTKLAQVRAN